MPGCCVQGLWRGTVPGLLLTVPYTAVQFVALQQCRSFAKRNGLMTGDWAFLLSFVSGAAAGAAATVASYPFDVLRTVLAAQGRPPVLAPTPGGHFVTRRAIAERATCQAQGHAP